MAINFNGNAPSVIDWEHQGQLRKVQILQFNGETIWTSAFDFGTINIASDQTNMNLRTFLMNSTAWNGVDPVTGTVNFSGEIYQTSPTANNGAAIYIPGHLFPIGSEVTLSNIKATGAGGKGADVQSPTALGSGQNGGAALIVSANSSSRLALKITGTGHLRGGGGGGGAILVEQEFSGDIMRGGCAGGGGRGRMPGLGGSVDGLPPSGRYVAGNAADGLVPGDGGTGYMPAGQYFGGQGGVFGGIGKSGSTAGPDLTGSSPGGQAGRAIRGRNHIATLSNNISLSGPVENT